MAASLKVVLLVTDVVPFNSDEAVVALMSRHILQGERPIFYYGQAYMGSLDAWTVAIVFRLIGEGVLAVRAVQIVLYLFYMITLWLLARTLFTERRIPLIVVTLAALPTVLITTYTTASLGGYGELLIMGNLILWLGYQVTWGKWQSAFGAWLALGMVGGLAFWTLGMALVYLLPVGIIILWRFRTRMAGLVLLCLVGFVIGSFPWWFYNLTHNWSALHMLIEAKPVNTSVSDHLISLLALGLPVLLGIRFPWSASLSPPLLLFINTLLYLCAGTYLVWKLRNDRETLASGTVYLLGIFMLIFTLVFLGTRFGIDASGRYLLPMYLLVVFTLALAINAAWEMRPVFGISLLLVVLTLNCIETWRAASLPDGITTQFDPITRFDNAYDAELMAFLRQEGETRGYSNYWVSFRLAFLSNEDLIYAAALPYKSDLSLASGDNRYPQYAQVVSESDRLAYITSLHPQLDGFLQDQYSALGVSFDERQIGPFHIFYNLSRAVQLSEIGLDRLSP